ncbi:MAG: hypothetical protein HY236_10850, partial [Acidobacteria bacterium]|nr:hypothetical protein [Acidobacteriota bacterium]
MRSWVIVLALFPCVTPAQSPYVRERVGEPRTAATVESGPFAYIPIEQWQGKRVIFLPESAKTREYGYQSFTGGSGRFGRPTYEECVGKTGKVVQVTTERYAKVTVEMEENGKRYEGTVYADNLDGVAFLDE